MNIGNLKDLIIPTYSNNFTPILISKKLIFTYILFIFLVNTVFSGLLNQTITNTSYSTVNSPKVLGLSSNINSDSVTSENIIKLTNIDRGNYGLNSLATNTNLNSAAQSKAEDMMKYQYWSHVNPTTGKTPWDFIIDSGIEYTYAGENLAEGFNSASSLNSAWMTSQ